VGATTAAVAVAAVVVWRIVLRDQARPVSVDDALERYREIAPVTDTTSTAPAPSTVVTTSLPAPVAPRTTVRASTTTSVAASTSTVAIAPQTLPEPGVYRYRTLGRESIDALDGATHEYPAETTITVTSEGCGVRLRWDVLRERREEWVLCVTDDGVELQPEAVQYHEFFGQPDSQDARCTTPTLLVPADGEPRQPARLDCMLADDPWLPVWEVLDTSARTVDGEDVEVVHARMTVVDEDEYWDRTTIDWYLDRSGLIVEASAVKESRSPSPIGGVVYEEQYTIELVSLEPLR
jgi:hypothetical protein